MRQQDAYDRSNAQLYGAFKYPILRNEDAVMLVGLIDECIYKVLKTLDGTTDFIRRQYAVLAVDALFKGTEKSYSSISDYGLFRALPILTEEDWLDIVRNDLIVYRGHWIRVLTAFLKKYEIYLQYVCTQDPKAATIEDELDASPNSLYGAVMEARHQLDRVTGILERMVRPYLRKVVSLARTFARFPGAFEENYQNGYHGVLLAIGRYDVRIGAFAFMVEMWIKSKMITGVTSASNSMTMPTRIWKHKKILDRHPNLEVDEIAKLEKIDSNLLQNSMQLLKSRNAMPLIEENDENSESLECYHDTQVDREHDLMLVRQQLETYSKNLRVRDRIILSIAFDVDMNIDEIDQNELDHEAARQLYSSRLMSA
jgi:DNA-directed RNA polymerase specialized sigma subunit